MKTSLLCLKPSSLKASHEGWKKLTRLPKHGNYNPNWSDCLKYIERVIQLGLHENYECPYLPVEKGLVDRRGQCSTSNYWLLMRELCLVYKSLLQVNRRCKRDGTLARLYNEGKIGCNLFSDIPVGKAVLSSL
jgi:hypothetical protein